jgi:hypothetical protein
LIVERTLQTAHGGPRVACGDWVPALVDAARVGPERATSFHAAVRAALEEASAASLAKPRPAWNPRWTFFDGAATPFFALAILTRDLDATAPTLKKSAPKLFKLLGAQDTGARDRLTTTRRTWLARLGGPSLVPEVVAFWRDHATRFVPDPGDTTADYSQSADWLAAVQELNPTAAGELLGRWTTTYHLKRNLWRDLAQRGVPTPAGIHAAPSAASSRKRSHRY